MKLTTLKEAIQAMLDGKTVISNSGDEWRFAVSRFERLYEEDGSPAWLNAPVWLNADVSGIGLPATIKEEPEIWYEVLVPAANGYGGSLQIMNDGQILNHGLHKEILKTGRMFIKPDVKFMPYKGEE